MAAPVARAAVVALRGRILPRAGPIPAITHGGVPASGSSGRVGPIPAITHGGVPTSGSSGRVGPFSGSRRQFTNEPEEDEAVRGIVKEIEAMDTKSLTYLRKCIDEKLYGHSCSKLNIGHNKLIDQEERIYQSNDSLWEATEMKLDENRAKTQDMLEYYLRRKKWHERRERVLVCASGLFIAFCIFR